MAVSRRNQHPVADAELRTAISQYNARNYDRALALVDAALSRQPEHGRLWELRGLIQHGRGEPQAALDALETASALVPLRPASQAVLAACYAAIGRRELARDVYCQVAALPYAGSGLLLEIAAALNDLGTAALAVRVCREASQRDPDAAEPYYDLSYYLGRCGAPLELVESLARRAIGLAPERVSYRVGLASLLYRARRADDAYQVVGRLTARQIREIGCRCCLERVIEVYEAGGDALRARLGRQRLKQLETTRMSLSGLPVSRRRRSTDAD